MIDEERLKYIESMILARKEATEYFEYVRDSILDTSHKCMNQGDVNNSIRDMAVLELLQIFINKSKELTTKTGGQDGYTTNIKPNIE